MFMQCRLSSAVVAMAMAGAAVCSAQSITSAHSGTLHYFDGDVSIDGAPVQSKVGKFSEVKEQGVLSTALGRAEVLLTPGVFLRLGENTSIRMLDARLASTRVDILSGNVILEADDTGMSVKDSPVVLLYKNYEIRMQKHGLAELNSDQGQLKVFKGEALVEVAPNAGNSNRASVKEGRQLSFSAALFTEKFDEKSGDDLYMWARDRSQSLSAANMSSAHALSSGSSYLGGNGGSSPGWNGGWYYNPSFGMFTYIPMAGTLWNPWGYGFFSPGTIGDYYVPTAYWYGGGGPVGGSVIGRPLSGLNRGLNGTAVPMRQLLTSSSGSNAMAGPAIRGGNAFGAAASRSSAGGNTAGFPSGHAGGGAGGGVAGRASGHR